MKLVIISDTHCTEPALPAGDMLIHCGDLTYGGRMHESLDGLKWLSSQPHAFKLLIAGNHEVEWEDKPYTWPELIKTNFPGITYLHDEGIEIDGLKFWGSPYQPHFMGWAFQKARGDELKEHWKKIPEGTDVLVTHGPPKGFGDCNERDERFGDEDLLHRVLEVRPQIHCFGHAHHGYGQWFFQGIQFINAAVLNEGYILANAPVEVEIDCK